MIPRGRLSEWLAGRELPPEEPMPAASAASAAAAAEASRSCVGGLGATRGTAARRGEARREPDREPESGGEASKSASSVGEVSCGESEPLAPHTPAPSLSPGVGSPPLLPRSERP